MFVPQMNQVYIYNGKKINKIVDNLNYLHLNYLT